VIKWTNQSTFLKFIFKDEAQEAEAIQMLNAVYDIREQSSKQNFASIAKICHTLSMLYFILDDVQRVSTSFCKCLSGVRSIQCIKVTLCLLVVS